ncbi:WRB/Get1 family [Cladochytrium replicatum]|nr:WRB/Get1 family [Cladochytrium replicatum]
MLYRQTFKKEKDDELKKRRKEILDIKGDLSRTSAQDEFSKWAKLRRKLDKQVAEYEKECKSGSMDKAKFEVAVSWGLWAAMLFFQAVVMLAYRTTAMFYIPLEWSGPLHWILSFPFAPKGLSIQMLADPRNLNL